MFIHEIIEKNFWENFLKTIKEKSFLHSWNWGEFQRKTGEKIWRLGIYNNDHQIIGVALIIKITAKRGHFLFIPHGPLLREIPLVDKKKAMEILLNRLKGVAKREKIIFIRIAPFFDRSEENIEIFRELGFRPAPIHVHPEITWQLDITPEREEILKNMRKTTRNLIRRAQKEEVKIYFSKNVKDIKLFYDLYRETVKRQHFAPFSYEFLEKEFESFLPENVLLSFAQWRNKILSGAMIIFWQRIAFYHQGASLGKFTKIPASYLLQWKIIDEARKKGCILYNFWGIAPTENRKHPWYGLSLFKKGFGGEKKEYVETQDLPLSYFYFKNWTVERIRKIKRRL